MMIVFVYDTEYCQHEEDDPANALLYFHPTWVSDTQKFSLCGQLMGTVHFLSETFGKTNVVSLQNGKFVLKKFGRFILVSISAIYFYIKNALNKTKTNHCYFRYHFPGCGHRQESKPVTFRTTR